MRTRTSSAQIVVKLPCKTYSLDSAWKAKFLKSKDSETLSRQQSGKNVTSHNYAFVTINALSDVNIMTVQLAELCGHQYDMALEYLLAIKEMVAKERIVNAETAV